MDIKVQHTGGYIMQLFSTILSINDTMTKDAFIELAIRWNQGSTHESNIIPDIVWNGERNIRFGDDKCWMQVEEYRNKNIIAIRYEKTEDDGVVWDTDYVMNFNTHKLAIRLERSYHEDSLRTDAKFSAPYFITLLIQKGFDFTAVLCDNDLMAEGLYDSVTGGGLRIPEDLSIVCFDETPHSSRCGLTTVSVEPVRMCRKAAELLFQRVNRPESDIEHILHKPTVIYRKSVKVVFDRNFGECMA